jgi:hypothetical protein
MKRYYIAWSSWFDSHPYDIDKIKATVKLGGGKNIRTSNQYGWSNMPKVVTFDCNPDTLINVNKGLKEALETTWIIILFKEW